MAGGKDVKGGIPHKGFGVATGLEKLKSTSAGAMDGDRTLSGAVQHLQRHHTENCKPSMQSINKREN